jgi:hypothetical protein
MSLITQYSRISHHTISPSGTTFTVPSQEDFTSTSSPWSITDLALSEFGVNQSDNKLYVRIGSNINEVGLNISGGTGGTLTGTPNQVVYFDQNGNPTSDSGFTHSFTGGTMFYVSPVDAIQYGLSNGQLFADTGTTGSALFYNDSTDGNNYSNFVASLESIDLGSSFKNISALGWQDQGISQNQSLVLVSHFSGSPMIVMQSQQYTDTGYTTTYGGFAELFSGGSQFGYQSGNTFAGIQVDNLEGVFIESTDRINIISADISLLCSGATIGSGFTYSNYTGTTISNNPDAGSTFELVVGGEIGNNSGSVAALSYNDTVNNYQNIIGVFSGNSTGDVGLHTSLMGFANNNTGDGAFVIASNNNGTPTVYLQTSNLSGGTISTIGITEDQEIINVSNGNYTGSFDIATSGTSLEFQLTSGGTTSGFYAIGSTDNINTVAQIQSSGTTWTWANVDGASGSILTTNGSGQLSFTPPATGLTGSYTVGTNTLTLVNGLITAIA